MRILIDRPLTKQEKKQISKWLNETLNMFYYAEELSKKISNGKTVKTINESKSTKKIKIKKKQLHTDDAD